MKKWIYRIVSSHGSNMTTYEYEKEDVDSFFSSAYEVGVRMKNGAEFGHNMRYVVTWRLIEIDA